jgi:hypothetical protein
MDTDSTWAVTTNQFPDIYARGLNVENGALTATHNFTVDDPNLHGKINWMYMQTTTLKNNIGTNAYYDLGFTTTTSYNNNNDALDAVKHFYIKGISFSEPEFNNVDCSSLNISSLTVTNPTADTLSNGSIVANVTGGSAPYSYSWNTTPAQSSQTATNVGEGVYLVTVSDNAGCVTTASVTISLASVKNINFSKLVQVYPNPTNSDLFLNLSKELGNTVTVQITSVDGKVVYNANNLSTGVINKIEMSTLTNGLYFVKVTSGNQSGVIKVTKN